MSDVCYTLISAVIFLFFAIIDAAMIGIGNWIRTGNPFILRLLEKSASGDGSETHTFQEKSLLEIGADLLFAFGIASLLFGLIVTIIALAILLSDNRFFTSVYARKGCTKAIIATLITIGVILVAGTIAAVALGVTYKNKITSDDEQIKTGLASFQSQRYIGIPYDLEQKDSVSRKWDGVMIDFECCGINGTSDFTVNYNDSARRWYDHFRGFTACESSGSKSHNASEMKVPVACCEFNSKEVTTEDWTPCDNPLKDKNCPVTMTTVKTKGCFDAMMEFGEKMSSAVVVTGSVALAFKIIGLLVIIFFVIAYVIMAMLNDED